jgi:hypothetical protein
MTQNAVQAARMLMQARREFRRARNTQENAATLVALADTVDAQWGELNAALREATVEQTREVVRIMAEPST